MHTTRRVPPQPSFSLVIPAYNEAESLCDLLREIRAREGLRHVEVIVVDDGSSDGTVERLRALRAQGLAARIVRHAGNLGQSSAMHTGVRLAQGDWIVTMDGDGQNDPADVERLIERLAEEDEAGSLELICGHRHHRNDPWLKRVSSRIANAVRAGLLGDGTPDTGCGLKVIKRSAFLDLPYFDHMHRFLPALILRHGGRVISVKV
ncbi:MAG: glycosyltransferase family 2 protein, partial [Pseudomonadota bacterium]